MEFVFRVKLDVRHRLVFGDIEGRHRWFRRAEFLKVAAGIGQAKVVGVGRPVTPGLPIRLSGGSNGGLAMALVMFKLGQDIERIGVKERIRPALGGGPDLVEEFARGVVVLLLPVQFGQSGESGEFFSDVVDGTGTGKGMVQALGGGGQVAYAQGCLAVESGGSDEVAFMAPDVRQFPGVLRERQRLAGLTEPKAALREVDVGEAFALCVFSCNHDFQRTAQGDR